MIIRHATMADLDAIAEIERICFPEAEAASRDSFEKRLAVFPDHFWLLEKDKRIIGLINGMVSDEEYLRDEMYADADMHNENGDWQMIFGVEVLPEYQRKGYAAMIMKQVFEDSKARGKKGVVLNCKDFRVPYYEKLGFKYERKSPSDHGGAVWYDMRAVFDQDDNK